MNSGKSKNLALYAFFIFAVVIAFLFVNGCAGTGVAAPEKEGSCVSAKCHANMGKEKYVHGPLAAGDCTYC